MTAGDQYRIRAIEFEAKATTEPNPKRKAEYENLARSYARLAEQADRNARVDLTYQPPPAPPKFDC
jgi:hypothetical protein